MTETATKWSERVKEWKASGQTARAFAQGRDFKPSTLTYWAHRLRRVADQPAASTTAEGPPTRSSPTVGVRLVRVRRTRERVPKPTEPKAPPATPEGSSSAALVIALGAARIEVRRGFDARLLSDVVEALGGAQ
jgi:hypothetical protein